MEIPIPGKMVSDNFITQSLSPIFETLQYLMIRIICDIGMGPRSYITRVGATTKDKFKAILGLHWMNNKGLK